MRKYTPADAMHLLRSRTIVEHACDVVKNPAFAKASATTRDAFGMRVIDYVGSPEERRSWPDQLTRLFTMPLEQFETQMAQEPVRRSQIPKPNGGSREIAIPTFLRRCVSNALNDVLAKTSEGVLPSCVRAYRRGQGSAVRESILDVAERVHEGRVRFFAKLDIRSFFSQMPWPAIEVALRHYGYDQRFIALTMAVVKCRVVRNERGRLVAEQTVKGAQMGLAESAVLANLVLFVLDHELGGHAPRRVYLRYSDDLFIGAAEKHVVVHAVRRIASWCREHGLQLKGVAHNACLANLVQDVKKTKIGFLGADIDHLGYAHMPKGKLHAKLAELAYMEERLATDSVRGVSRYSNGGGADVFDADDLERSKQAFIDYWSDLDPRRTPQARRIMERRFPSTSVPSDTERGTVWIARLWGDRTDRVGGSGRTIHDPSGHSEGGPPRPSRMSPTATGGLARADAECGSGYLTESCTSSETCLSVPAPMLHACNVAGEGVHVSLTEEPLIGPACTGVVRGSSRTMEKDASRLTAERRESDRFESQSLVEDLDACIDQDLKFPVDPSIDEDLGSLSDPTDGASPPRSVFENTWVQLVHAVSVRVGGQRVAVVGRCEASRGVCRGVRVHVVRRCRVEAALVRQLLREVRRSDPAPLVLGVTSTWLAKSLLQGRRRFRAPLLFGHILDLHAAARGRDVVLIGGLPMPEPLASAINARIDRLALDAACDAVGGSPFVSNVQGQPVRSADASAPRRHAPQ